MRIFVFLFFVFFFLFGCNPSETSKTNANDASTQYFYHNLLFQWKDSINPEVKDHMLALLKGIPQQIDGFESIAFYELVPGDGEFDLLVIQKYTTKKAEEIYQIHPDHLKAKSLGPQLIQNMAEFDYWD